MGLSITDVGLSIIGSVSELGLQNPNTEITGLLITDVGLLIRVSEIGP